MASKIGLAFRREKAEKRLATSFRRIAAELDLTFDAPSAKRRDGDTEAVEFLELVANRLDAIHAAISGTADDPEIEAEAQGVEIGTEVTKDGTPVVVTEAIDGETAKPVKGKKA